MKIHFLFLLMLLQPMMTVLASDAQDCQKFVSQGENYKIAHEHDACLAAVLTGDGHANYSVGMAYGFAGKHDLEVEHYREAARQKVTAAYLALGHALRDSNEGEAISWYKKFVETRTGGYGYAALLLSQIHSSNGNNKQADHWMNVCRESPYSDNCDSSD